jgi:hypothetical protein
MALIPLHSCGVEESIRELESPSMESIEFMESRGLELLDKQLSIDLQDYTGGKT